MENRSKKSPHKRKKKPFEFDLSEKSKTCDFQTSDNGKKQSEDYYVEIRLQIRNV